MSSPRFFVPDLAGPGTRVHLSAADGHHALRALRLRPGEEVALGDGRGRIGRGRLLAGEGGLVAAEVLEAADLMRPGPRVEVALAPPKGDRLVWAVQKLVELGTDAILLVRADRSVREWEGEREVRARERLSGVAREAAMQSHRAFLPELWLGRTAVDACRADGGSAVVVLDGSAPEGLLAVLAGSTASTAPAAGGVRLVVGPEGGLTEAELREARSGGARLASLGPTVLRAETAAVAGAAVALAAVGRLS